MKFPSLSHFGISEPEIDMYETLLPLGSVPVAEVTKIVGRHPQVVYRLLDQLTAKGLVLTEVRRHRRYVRAEDPAMFLKAQEEKVQDLRAAVPELAALRTIPKEATVHIARGDDAVRMLRTRAFHDLPKGETYYILSASGTRFYEVMDEELDRIEQMRLKRGVQKRILAFESQRKFLSEKEQWGLTEMRYLSETHDVPSSTNIYGNTVAIVIWSAEPIVITIESREVARSYKQYFDSLWKTARS
jgi:sugar-specific transcriptional regulator TrmB